jgi:hypothetical protein
MSLLLGMSACTRIHETETPINQEEKRCGITILSFLYRQVPRGHRRVSSEWRSCGAGLLPPVTTREHHHHQARRATPLVRHKPSLAVPCLVEGSYGCC